MTVPAAVRPAGGAHASGRAPPSLPRCAVATELFAFVAMGQEIPCRQPMPALETAPCSVTRTFVSCRMANIDCVYDGPETLTGFVAEFSTKSETGRLVSWRFVATCPCPPAQRRTLIRLVTPSTPNTYHPSDSAMSFSESVGTTPTKVTTAFRTPIRTCVHRRKGPSRARSRRHPRWLRRCPPRAGQPPGG